MRKSDIFVAFCVISTLVLSYLTVILPKTVLGQQSERIRRQQILVKTLGLADLCLFTEARHTRHITLADRHSPFQNHPMALDHFPSGSMVSPPALRTGSLQ